MRQNAVVAETQTVETQTEVKLCYSQNVPSFVKCTKVVTQGSLIVEAPLHSDKLIGLKSLTRGRMTARQIEAARRTITRKIKRGGKIWIRVFPDKPITNKPLEVRMGKGKGPVEYWVCEIKPGKVLYEIEGVSEELARDALTLAAAKLPFKTTIVKRTIM